MNFSLDITFLSVFAVPLCFKIIGNTEAQRTQRINCTAKVTCQGKFCGIALDKAFVLDKKQDDVIIMLDFRIKFFNFVTIQPATQNGYISFIVSITSISSTKSI